MTDEQFNLFYESIQSLIREIRISVCRLACAIENIPIYNSENNENIDNSLENINKEFTRYVKLIIEDNKVCKIGSEK
jgi:hypothetical protein